jgi:hypothetical protein
LQARARRRERGVVRRIVRASELADRETAADRCRRALEIVDARVAFARVRRAGRRTDVRAGRDGLSAADLGEAKRVELARRLAVDAEHDEARNAATLDRGRDFFGRVRPRHAPHHERHHRRTSTRALRTHLTDHELAAAHFLGGKWLDLRDWTRLTRWLIGPNDRPACHTRDNPGNASDAGQVCSHQVHHNSRDLDPANR